MKRNVAFAVLVAVVVLVCAMTLSAEPTPVFGPFQNQLDTTQQFTLTSPLVLGVSAQANTQLNQTTRAEIYSYVQDNPGVHFRGVCDGLGLSVGMVQYHVGILVSAGFLSVYSDGKMQRFFQSGKYSQTQKKIVSLLRHRTTRNILRIISEKKAVSHGELAAELSITSQGLTWQMHRLKKAGVIKETKNGLRLIYCINKADAASVNEMIKQAN